ncbi:hypothetical protein MCOR31_008565 [Pyricularia oryzae]|nr:hypothetical protein MCOR19_009770 [Pyricularia oryzae]KAI6361736.1 hypothetical protein MCOR31_008565 [Pyricularia oryzae]KAI6397502.1 hypothetical protein MCOR23_006137 [Pyricularia oryzae]KAI6401240.1 hypothetical protein MCOR20_008144 [Pyricularia oryzae]KAI6461286.1 hypothetical protein MCOR15_005069 [Pyricularia oryzae]
MITSTAGRRQRHPNLGEKTQTNCTGDIPLASLPQILQEFAEIRSWLGVRYPLIEPLCVYQDSAADRKQEASIMGDTYGGVLINMAATDAGAAGGWDDYAAARTGPPVGRSSRHGRGPVVIAGVIRLPAVPGQYCGYLEERRFSAKNLTTFSQRFCDCVVMAKQCWRRWVCLQYTAPWAMPNWC